MRFVDFCRRPARLGLSVMLLTALGCQRMPVAYRFAPPAAAPITTAIPDGAGAAPSLDAVAVAPARSAGVSGRPSKGQPQFFRQPSRLKINRVPATLRLVRRPSPSPEAVRHRLHRTALPQRPAEAGLGTTVLGVLGLVVGPISLLGLLVWGGPVWAVLLGLSALAVLVAWLDPFG